MYLLWKTEHKLVEQIETRYYLHIWQMSAVTEAHIIKTATTTLSRVSVWFKFYASLEISEKIYVANAEMKNMFSQLKWKLTTSRNVNQSLQKMLC
jgi:hypothetical protein